MRVFTSPSRLGLFVYLFALFGISFCAVTLKPESAPAAVDSSAAVQIGAPQSAVDMDTDTELAEASASVKPNPVDARLVGQLAKGMRHIIDTRDRGQWAYCGEILDDSEQDKVSHAIAYQLVSNMQSLGADFSPWGVASTMYNESRFDACALGLGPRSWAYQKGLLRKPRTHISHASEDVLRVVGSEQARRRFALSGFDLGLCQVLSRFYRDETAETMISLVGSVRICVLEMKARADHYKTSTPWLYWRGSATRWYHGKIRRWAKRMGAPRGEV